MRLAPPVPQNGSGEAMDRGSSPKIDRADGLVDAFPAWPSCVVRTNLQLHD